MGRLVHLLDIGYPFTEISLCIFEIRIEHIPGTVASWSVDPLGAAVSHVNEQLCYLHAPRKIKGGMLQPSAGECDKPERMVIWITTEKGHQMGNCVRNPHPQHSFIEGLLLRQIAGIEQCMI